MPLKDVPFPGFSNPREHIHMTGGGYFTFSASSNPGGPSRMGDFQVSERTLFMMVSTYTLAAASKVSI